MAQRRFASDCTMWRSRCVEDSCDAELLERFVTSQDEIAFAALVARHGPMVFGVCRRLLRHAQDAEDAFQATFLILVRKAAGIGKRELLGNWLYGVALRVAARARLMAAKRQAKELADMERIALAAHEPAEATDLSTAIMEEVQRLPAKYRGPVVLYYLEGRTQEEVAGQMRCPVGTIKTRLSRAREMLHKRLTRRGLALTTAAFSTALLAEAPAATLPPGLIGSTCKAAIALAAGDVAAGGFVSAQAATLTKEVLRAMFVTKLKTVAVAIVALFVLFGGVGAFAYHRLAAEAGGKRDDKENIQVNQKTPAAPATDQERLQGTWMEVAVERDGKREQKEKERAKQLVFNGDKLLIKEKGKEFECFFKLDPKQNPRTIDITVKEPKMVQQGIYRLERDTLTVSFGKKERPREFNNASNAITILKHEPLKK